MSETIDFPEWERTTVRAFLSTSGHLERTVVRAGQQLLLRERMNDQARRVGLAICHMSFARGRDGWWVRSLGALAEGLGMDPSDLGKAIERLTGWHLLDIEREGEGVWLRLAPWRLIAQDRATGASAAFARLEREHESRRQLELAQPVLLAPRPEDRRDGGYGAALHEAALEAGAPRRPRVSPSVGPAEAERAAVRYGESPHSKGPKGWGDSPEGMGNLPIVSDLKYGETPQSEWGDSPGGMGNLPIACSSMSRASRHAPALAPGDSLNEEQIGDSRESGESRGCAARGKTAPSARGAKAGRFAEGDKNWLLERLEKLDPADFNKLDRATGEPVTRRKWIARVRDEPHAVERVLGDVEQDLRDGRKFTAVLGCVFTEARKLVRAAGRELKTILFL